MLGIRISVKTALKNMPPIMTVARPFFCPTRVCITSRIALFTTRPSKIRKPIVVSKSISCVVTRLSQRRAMTPPAIASGIDSITRNASHIERNIAAKISSKTIAATPRLFCNILKALSNRSAVPLYATLTSSGMISRSFGPATYSGVVQALPVPSFLVAE